MDVDKNFVAINNKTFTPHNKQAKTKEIKT
jgi:hypothetical protein